MKRPLAVVIFGVVTATAGAQTFDSGRAAEHLAQAVRFRTISHQDPAEDDKRELAGLRAFLERTYPRLHQALSRELVNGGALLYTWKGSDSGAPPALFMAHQDVVPVEAGTESAWTHPPFDGVLADGFVWGRGALDDKASLVFLMEAVESLLAEGFRPRRTIHLVSGFDEEVGGYQGAAKIASLLQSRSVHLEFVLDEGRSVTQGILPEVVVPVASIGVAEKGYVSIELVALAEGGHSARPPPESAIGILAAAIERLEGHQMPARLAGAPRAELVTLSPHMPRGRRWMLGNLWLFGPLVVRALEAQPTTNAVVRTTTAPTIFQAGVKENVLPSKARAVVNFRILQGDSVKDVVGHVRRVVDDERVKVAVIERTVSEPSPESSTDSPAYQLLVSTIGELFPEAVAAPSLMTGASDARHFIPLARDVYRFVPWRLGPEDITRYHGTNERFEIAQIEKAIEFYRRMLRAEPSTAGAVVR